MNLYFNLVKRAADWVVNEYHLTLTYLSPMLTEYYNMIQNTVFLDTPSQQELQARINYLTARKAHLAAALDAYTDTLPNRVCVICTQNPSIVVSIPCYHLQCCEHCLVGWIIQRQQQNQNTTCVVNCPLTGFERIRY